MMKHLLNYLILLGLILTQNSMLWGNNPEDLINQKKEMLLVEAISLISRDYNVYFTFDHNLVQNIIVEYETRKDQPVEAAISGVLVGTDLKFKLYDERFVILYQNDEKGLESLKELVKHFEHIIADGPERKAARRNFKPVTTIPLREAWVPPARKLQNLAINVSGTVTDQEGEPLIGVNVQVKGTTKGTATDFDGGYILNDVNENAILVFSYVGYQTQEIPVDGRNLVDLIMLTDAQLLQEVVVVGYGTQKKESVVGAISQVGGEKLRKTVQGADLGVALTGQLPGLSVVRSSGRPGGADFEGTDDDYAYLYIRGQKTWNQSGPLVLVDGVERELYQINPNEIENISILKDASATAVYGVKGANGVILVTTIRGKEGAPQLSFDGGMGAKGLSRFMHRENSYWANTMKNYAIMNELPIRESAWNFVVPGNWLEYWRDHTYPEYLPDIDWTDEFTKDWAMDQNINMTLRGGTKIVKYFGSLSYLHEGDLINLGGQGLEKRYEPSFSFDRFNFRSNLDFDITPSTRFSTNLSGYHAIQNQPAGSKWSAWFAMYSRPPDLYPPKYSDGTWADYQGYARLTNGLYLFNMYGYNVHKRTNLQTDFMLTQELDFITKGLSMKGKVSFDNTFGSEGPNVSGYGDITKYIFPEIVDEIHAGMSEAEIKELEEKYTEWQFPGSGGNHGFDWVTPQNYYRTESGTNQQTFRRLYYEASLNYARDFGVHSVSGLGLVSRQEQALGSAFISYREDWVGRITYGYNGRYNLEVNGAYNGSEKFSRKYRFGFFPSIGVGWTVSNEPFFQDLTPKISLLRFRYSNGKIGSDAGIERWLYVNSWIVKDGSGSEDYYRFGAPYLQSAYPFRYEGVLGNPDIHWETAHKQDFGIETGFFDDMFTLNFDWFWEQRSDIFMTGADIPKPDYFGKPPVSQNLGEVDSWGWEFEFHFKKRFSNGIYLWLSQNWTYAKDEIIERADPRLKPDYQKQAGYQIGQPRVTLNQYSHPMLTWNEIYNTPWGTGNLESALPGDFARVDYNSDGLIDNNDNIPFGYPTRPQYTYAPSFGVEYKNWSFYTQWYGVYNVAGSIGAYLGNFSELYSIVYPYVRTDAWSPEFDNLADATLSGVRFQSNGTSGYVERSRAYLRLQRVELSYDLKPNWLSRLGISNLKLTLGGDNLILISKMLEDLDAPQITDEVNVRRQYPTTRRLNLRVSFNF